MEYYVTFVFLHFQTHAFLLCFQLTQMAEEEDDNSDPGRSINEQEDRPEDQDVDPQTDLPTGPASESSSIHPKAPHKPSRKAQREVVEVLEDLLKALDKERKEAAQKVHCVVISVQD